MNDSYPQINWNDNFNTGVQEIDEQHMILVNTLNEASATLASDSSQMILQKIVQDLLAYALYHFETEESLMQQYDYMEADNSAMQQHLKEHRGFSQQVVTVREQLQDGVAVDAPELLNFLNQWLVKHILKTDQAVGKWILAKRAATKEI